MKTSIGLCGATGKTPELQIGQVKTVDYTQKASVEITGTRENPVLNFNIPKGKDGAKLIVKEKFLNADDIISDIVTNDDNNVLTQKAIKTLIDKQVSNKTFNMSNLSDEVKKAMTGGSVAVVGENTVKTNNIVDGQVISRKLGDDVLKFKNVNLILNKFPGGFINWNNGDIQEADEYMYTDFIQINNIDKLYCNFSTHYSIYDENKRFLKGVRGGTAITQNKTIDEIDNVTGGYYIRLSTNINNSNDIILSDNKDFLTDNEYHISNSLNNRKILLEGEWIVKPTQLGKSVINKSHVNETICTLTPSQNKFNPSTTTKGFVNWNGSDLIESDDYVTSDYINVKEGDIIYQTFNTHYTFYNSNKIRVDGHRDTETPNHLIAPKDACFIRVSININRNNPDSYMLSINEPIEEFIPFGYNIDESKGAITLKSLTKIEKNLDKFKSSRFYGKKVSWFGTSITQGYAWCERVNNVFNFNATNNGVGGTTISQESDVSSMCTLSRINGEYTNITDPNTGNITHNGVAIPKDVDVIFIEGGTNDWARNWKIGDTKFTDNPDTKTFGGACHQMFRNLTQLFPKAELIVLGSPFGKMPNRNQFDNKYGVLNNNNLQTVEYGDILLDIAGKWGCKGINIGRLMQINDNNVDEILPDGLHLNTVESQQKASDVIINYLLKI